jgi:hypothetical protein
MLIIYSLFKCLKYVYVITYTQTEWYYNGIMQQGWSQPLYNILVVGVYLWVPNWE